MSEDGPYRLTPLGLFNTEMTYEQAKALENVIISYLKKAGENALILDEDDGCLIFETVRMEWDK